MRNDTPPPEDDSLSDGYPATVDDIEIIEEYEIESIENYGLDDLDQSMLTFTGHSAPVFCCEFDKSYQHAVTGGQDDKGYVWNPRTGEIIFECKGHKDSVISASFSYDGKYVATADMAGALKVWNMNDHESTVFDTDLMEDFRFLQWNSVCNVLFGGVADGNCWMWKVPTGETKVFQGHGSACCSGRVLPSGVEAVIGYDDGTVRFLDLKTSTTEHFLDGQYGHEGSVIALDCNSENVLVLTGSIDGTSKLIKVSDGKVLSTLRCEPEDIEHKCVETVAFFPSFPLVATGTVCGSLAIWDTATQVRRLQCEQESSITKLICDVGVPMVYTAGQDGIVRLTDGRTGQMEKFFSGHKDAILDMTLSSDAYTIMTASDDRTCKIFDTRM